MKDPSRPKDEDFDPTDLRRQLGARIRPGERTVEGLLEEVSTRTHGASTGSGGGRNKAGAAEAARQAAAGKYELGAFIAKGGMGAVFDAEDKDVGRTVALKVLLAGSKAGLDKVSRFVNEARITGQLEHPNIVPVHDLGISAAGAPYYTMTYVRGVTLRQVVREIAAGDAATIARYPLNTLLTVFLKACDALNFAHSKGVVHRDLKPENIMIGEYGEVLVMDWGLAKMVQGLGDGTLTAAVNRHIDAQLDQGGAGADDDAVSHETVHGGVVGTPSYMAPEQAAGDDEMIDQRTDIYALGGMLYNILTLDVPIRANSLAELVDLKQEDNVIDAPETYNPDGLNQRPLPHCPNSRVPRALSAIAMKALSRRRVDRYRSVVDLQEDIEAYRGGFATAAEQAGSLRLAWLLIKRRRREAAILAASLLIILTILASFGVVQMRNAQRLNTLYKEQKQLYDQREAAVEEQRRISREAAPKFVTKAGLLIEDQQWLEADREVDAAQTLDPDLLAARMLKLRILITQQKLAAAAELMATIDADRLAGESRSVLPRYRKIVKRFAPRQAQNGGKLGYRRQLELADQLRRVPDLPAAEKVYRESLQNALRERAYDAAVNAAVRLVEMRNPNIETIRSKSHVEGDRVELDFAANPNLTTIEGLRGLPLTKLSLADCRQLEDLEPLRGMPLQDLDISNTGVTTLSAIRNLPLISLNLSKTKVKKFDGLRDMPLRRLALKWAPILDLSDLPGAKLRELDLSYCQRVDDIAPLARLRQLEALSLQRTAISTIEPLSRLRLRELDLSGTRIRDLNPLRNMRTLEKLQLDWTRVTDIAPLTTLSLKSLSLYFTGVREIRAVGGMPLETLDVGKCRHLIDLRVLRTCRHLKVLRVPRQAGNIEFLKDHKNLKVLSYDTLTQDVEDFWREYKK